MQTINENCSHADLFENDNRTKVKNIIIRSASYFTPFSIIIPKKTRRFQSYCVGLPRSGTHSLAYVYSHHYRSTHEALKAYSIVNILDYKDGLISNKKMKSIIKFRDRLLQLEFEASHFLHHIIEHLVELFPFSKFVLTIREPLTWIESEINQNALTKQSIYWKLLEQYRYKLDKSDRDLNVYNIDKYIDYWNSHIMSVINNVPAERLLIVETTDIYTRIEEISEFIGADSSLIDASKVHSGKRKMQKYNIYNHYDKKDLQSRIKEKCQKQIEMKLPELLPKIDYF